MFKILQLCGMKTVVLVRHAKSSWDQPGQKDFDRVLAPRGRKDVPKMAHLIKEKGILPDKLVSSPAARAVETSEAFARENNIAIEDIQLDETIYEAMPQDLEKVVLNLSSDWDTVFLFGHNPGFTMFANRYSEGFRFDNVPTCGIVIIQSSSDNWADFHPGQAKISQWYFPKECIHC